MGFASSDEGQMLFDAVRMFGLPGVDHAGDLTDLQLRFIHTAWVERQEMLAPDTG